MKWIEYLPLAEKTLSEQFNCEDDFHQKILHAIIGSLTEIEEILDNYDVHGNLTKHVDKQGSIGEEVADALWYLSILFRELKLEEVRVEDNKYSNDPFTVLMGYLKINLKFLDLLKKKIYYNKNIESETMCRFSHDMYSMLVHFCKLYGADVDVILEKNIDKLKARYGEKFSSDRAINRDLETEKKILEN